MSKILNRAVLLLIAFVLVGARVNQEGEENVTCFPKDFETYRWVLAGNTWFTETNSRDTWVGAANECARIDPGRTSIGGPINSLETTRLKQHFHENWYYTNAIQVGGTEWYWATRRQEKQLTADKVTWSNWKSGEPGREGESCGQIDANKEWWDAECDHINKAICELRCDSL